MYTGHGPSGTDRDEYRPKRHPPLPRFLDPTEEGSCRQREYAANLDAVLADGRRGGAFEQFMRQNAEQATIPGQTHSVDPKALAPVLARFFSESNASG